MKEEKKKIGRFQRRNGQWRWKTARKEKNGL